MMYDSKYLVFDTPEAGPAIVVFPSFMKHVDVRNSFAASHPGYELLSGGFACLRGENSYAYGKSTSLGVESAAIDTDLLRRQIVGIEP